MNEKDTIKSYNDGEKKTRQATMLFKPSVYSGIKKIAYVKHSSIGGLVGEILEKYVKEHPDIIAKYDELVND